MSNAGPIAINPMRYSCRRWSPADVHPEGASEGLTKWLPSSLDTRFR
ncbi:hypothetical protein SZ54_3686 [Rhizobium sp. UR51a]|nr:hypothetical protein SZ54_3686 [Rhizobium sp. UR51a]